MIFPLEDRWGILSILEYEHGARKALLSLLSKNLLNFNHTDSKDREQFLSNTASIYAVSAFRQGKEFFRQAESSSWLVKPLLLYYGMLAVAKAGLVFQCPDYFCDSKNLLHGIGAGDRKKAAIDYKSDYIEIGKTGIYPLVRTAFEYNPLPDATRLALAEILTRLPEVDGVYRLVSHCEKDPINYVKIWGNVVYRDTDDQRVHIGFRLPAALFDLVKDRLPKEVIEATEIVQLNDTDGNKIVSFRSEESWDNEGVATEAVPRCLSRTLDHNFALILPIAISGTLYSMSEIELMYLAVFYLSSLARYQPHVWLEMHSGAEDLSVLLWQELIRSSENKFLSLLQRELQYAGLLPFVETVQATVSQEAKQPVASAR